MMGALVDVPIQQVAQTILQPPSAIDAVHMANNAAAPPAGTAPSASIPLAIVAVALLIYLL